MVSKTSRKKDDFLVQGSILAITSILVRIIGLAYRIPMVRILGNEGIGYYGYAFEIYNFCFIISSYGMPMAVSKLVSEYTAKKHYRASVKLLFGSLIIAFLIGGLLSSIVYFFSTTISSYFFANPAISIPLKVLAPTILISSVLGAVRGFFQGKGTMLPTAFSQIFEQLINAIISVIAAYYLTKSHSASINIAAYGAAGGVTGTAVGAFFGLVFMLTILLINIPYLRKQYRRDRYDQTSLSFLIRIILATIIPVILSQILVRSNGLLSMTLFNNILNKQGFSTDVTASLYGIYEGKYLLLCNIVMGVTSAITTAMIPSLVRDKVLSSRLDVEKRIRLALKFNLIIAIPATVGLSIIGGPIIKLLFGDTEQIISQIMLVGSVAITLYTVSILFSTIIQSLYSMLIPVIINLTALLINLPIMYFLLNNTELTVFALVIGNIILPIIVIILSYIVIRFRLRVRFEILKTIIVPTISALIMGIVVFFSYKLIYDFTNKNYLAVLISIPLGFFVFFILELLLQGINKRELKQFPMGSKLIRLGIRLRLLK